MAITASKQCTICKKIITSTGVKRMQEKLNKHMEIHRPKPKPATKAALQALSTPEVNLVGQAEVTYAKTRISNNQMSNLSATNQAL